MSRSSDLGALGGWLSSLGADAAPGLSPGQVVKVTPASQNALMTHIMGMPPDAVHLGASLDDYREYAARQEQQQRKASQFQQGMLHGLLRYPATATGTSSIPASSTSNNALVRLVDGQPPQGPETPERWLRRRVAEVQWRPA